MLLLRAHLRQARSSSDQIRCNVRRYLDSIIEGKKFLSFILKLGSPQKKAFESLSERIPQRKFCWFSLPRAIERDTYQKQIIVLVPISNCQKCNVKLINTYTAPLYPWRYIPKVDAATYMMKWGRRDLYPDQARTIVNWTHLTHGFLLILTFHSLDLEPLRAWLRYDPTMASGKDHDDVSHGRLVLGWGVLRRVVSKGEINILLIYQRHWLERLSFVLDGPRIKICGAIGMEQIGNYRRQNTTDFSGSI